LSKRLMITRSCKGRKFILTPLKKLVSIYFTVSKIN